MIEFETDDFSKLEYTGWQRVADKYLDHWAKLTGQFIEPLLDAAKVSKGMRVLDVACGPGIVSEKIYARGASPAGIDFSPEMIKLARKTYPHLEFSEGDAQYLPYEDASFDCVVMNFGMLHLPKPLQAMKEANRIIRTKGKFAFTVWPDASKSPAPKVMNDAKEKFADMTVTMPAALPYDHFGDKENCKGFLSEAGFDPQTMKYETKLAIWKVPTAGFLFETELNAGVRTAAFLHKQSTETLKQVKLAVEEGMQAFKSSDGYDLPFLGCIISANKK